MTSRFRDKIRAPCSLRSASGASPTEENEEESDESCDTDFVRTKATITSEGEYTEHTAKLLNENATPVRTLTFDAMKTDSYGVVTLYNYIGLGGGGYSKFQKEAFMTFSLENYGLETVNREKKTITEEEEKTGKMIRSVAEKKDNVEILDDD